MSEEEEIPVPPHYYRGDPIAAQMEQHRVLAAYRNAGFTANQIVARKEEVDGKKVPAIVALPDYYSDPELNQKMEYVGQYYACTEVLIKKAEEQFGNAGTLTMLIKPLEEARTSCLFFQALTQDEEARCRQKAALSCRTGTPLDVDTLLEVAADEKLNMFRRTLKGKDDLPVKLEMGIRKMGHECMTIAVVLDDAVFGFGSKSARPAQPAFESGPLFRTTRNSPELGGL